jgi:hypothetical protein
MVTLEILIQCHYAQWLARAPVSCQSRLVMITSCTQSWHDWEHHDIELLTLENLIQCHYSQWRLGAGRPGPGGFE